MLESSQNVLKNGTSSMACSEATMKRLSRRIHEFVSSLYLQLVLSINILYSLYYYCDFKLSYLVET